MSPFPLTLTATFSLTCVATFPLVLDFAVTHFMESAAPEVEIASTAITAFLLTALPVAVGVTLRAAAPRVTVSVAPGLSKVALVLFVSVVAGAIASNWRVVTDNFGRVGLGLLTLLVLMSISGLVVSRLLGASDPEVRTIVVETGVQNGALALAVAALLMPDGPTFNAYAIPAALYSVVWLGTAPSASLLATVSRRRVL